MPAVVLNRIGRDAAQLVADFGDFCVFVGQTFRWLITGGVPPRHLRTLMDQMYDIGVKSVPVIAVTGSFIGMVMAVETYAQFKALGQEGRLGAVIIISVVKEIGPVMAAVMLAGRIGGALTAELGTMNVTEQLDALRVMGTDPIRYLVIPRFLACLILTPVLTIFSDLTGIMGGWFVAVKVMGVADGDFWRYAKATVEMWQVNEGVIRSFFFGGAIALIGCYKGFNCGAGASGVGRACTQSFVNSFICIIIMDFFFAKIGQDWYRALYGVRSALTG